MSDDTKKDKNAKGGAEEKKKEPELCPACTLAVEKHMRSMVIRYAAVATTIIGLVGAGLGYLGWQTIGSTLDTKIVDKIKERNAEIETFAKNMAKAAGDARGDAVIAKTTADALSKEIEKERDAAKGYSANAKDAASDARQSADSVKQTASNLGTDRAFIGRVADAARLGIQDSIDRLARFRALPIGRFEGDYEVWPKDATAPEPGLANIHIISDRVCVIRTGADQTTSAFFVINQGGNDLFLTNASLNWNGNVLKTLKPVNGREGVFVWDNGTEYRRVQRASR